MKRIQFGNTTGEMRNQDGEDLVRTATYYGEAITAQPGVEYKDIPELLKELTKILENFGIDIPHEMPEFIRSYHFAEISWFAGLPWTATLIVIDKSHIYSWWLNSDDGSGNVATFMGKKKFKL